jgi:hypothetical protein
MPQVSLAPSLYTTRDGATNVDGGIDGVRRGECLRSISWTSNRWTAIQWELNIVWRSGLPGGLALGDVGFHKASGYGDLAIPPRSVIILLQGGFFSLLKREQ